MLEELLLNPFILLAIAFWDTCWKLWAMWIAGKKKSKIWFVALFIINSIGILPILYIFLISKKKRKK